MSLHCTFSTGGPRATATKMRDAASRIDLCMQNFSQIRSAVLKMNRRTNSKLNIPRYPGRDNNSNTKDNVYGSVIMHSYCESSPGSAHSIVLLNVCPGFHVCLLRRVNRHNLPAVGQFVSCRSAEQVQF